MTRQDKVRWLQSLAAQDMIWESLDELLHGYRNMMDEYSSQVYPDMF